MLQMYHTPPWYTWITYGLIIIIVLLLLLHGYLLLYGHLFVAYWPLLANMGYFLDALLWSGDRSIISRRHRGNLCFCSMSRNVKFLKNYPKWRQQQIEFLHLIMSLMLRLIGNSCTLTCSCHHIQRCNVHFRIWNEFNRSIEHPLHIQ